jgi:hypothetical protein
VSLPPSKPSKPSGSKERRIVPVKPVGNTEVHDDDVDVIMSMEDRDELRSRIKSTKKVIDEGFFVMSGLISRAHEIKAYIDWGYSKWSDYLEQELNMSLRKAQYYQQIWQWFVIEIKDPSIREKVRSIGWSKCKDLVGVCNEDNVDEWVRLAGQLNVKDFAKEAKNALRRIHGMGPDENTERFYRLSFQLAEEQNDNVQRALEVAGNIAESDKKGHLIDLICTDFLSNNIFPNNPNKRDVESFLTKYESMLGVRLLAVDMTAEEVVFGADILERLDG